MDKAARVCIICKARKKACDKCLPKCGYCTKRDLDCNYDETSSTEIPLQHHGYPFHSSRTGPQHDSVSNPPGLLRTQLTVDDMIYEQLRRVVYLTGIPISQMFDEFFRGVHTVFPVVSAGSLRANLSAHENQVPPADFALVILSMYLLTIRSMKGPDFVDLVSADMFYVTIKMLLGHVQALKISSIYLVQASLLLAAFEYACCRPYAAYLTIGTCGRMALVVDIDESHNSYQSLCEVLGEGTLGGLVLLER